MPEGSWFLRRELKSVSPDARKIKGIQVDRSSYHIEVSGGPDRLIVKTTSGMLLFTFGSKSISAKEAKAILNEAFGKIVR